MSHLTEELVLERLKVVKFPGYSRDIVSFGLVKEIKIAGSDLLVRLSVATSNPSVAQTLKKESDQALSTIAGVRSAKVVIDITNPPEVASGGQTGTTKIAGVSHVIAIASGKGGVGKSTVAANLAASSGSLRRRGWPVRLRHLRTEYLVDVRRNTGTPDGQRRQHHHSHGAIRHQTNVNGIAAGRQFSSHSARADGHQSNATISSPGGLDWS